MIGKIPYENILISDDLDALVNNNQVPVASALIIVCRQGRLRVELNQDNYEIQQNDLLFCMPDFLLGHYMHTPDFQCQIFSFTSDSLSDIAYSCLRLQDNWYDKYQFLSNHPIIHLNEHRLQLSEAYGQLVELYSQESTTYQKRIADMLAQAIIFEMISWVDESMHEQQEDIVPVNETIANTHTTQLFSQFVRLLENNRTSRHPVSWYADQMAISAKYLTYICNQVAKKTPSDIINDIAIREIKQRLLATDESIKEIAFSMDFATASSFCKYFRIHTGMSAQAFRKQKG